MHGNQYQSQHNIPYKAGTKEYTRAWRLKNVKKQQGYISKHRNKMTDLKQQAIDYKGGCCQKCSYNKCNGALDFHHIDPSNKLYGISDAINRHLVTTLEQLIPELDKCLLLCKNCHYEIHEQNNWKEMIN